MLKLYLITLTCFLAIISFIVTYEIYRIFNDYVIINNKLSYNQEAVQDDLYLAKVYMKRKKWLSCIFMLEKGISQENIYIAKNYNILGFCYYNVKQYKCAEQYYKEATKKEPNNTIFLCNLAKIYVLTKQYQNAKKTYQQVIKIDKNNKKAREQLLLLNKYNRDSRI